MNNVLKFFATFLASILIVYYGYTEGLKQHKSEIKITFSDFTESTRKQIVCLADNIFFEAANESEQGKKAVAFVTLNRVNSSRYPNSVCDVVKQKGKNVCQFSWYCEERLRRLHYSKNLTKAQEKLYSDILDVAIYVYLNYETMEDPTKGALFYHADYVDPYWKKSKFQTAVIGRHIFYGK